MCGRGQCKRGRGVWSAALWLAALVSLIALSARPLWASDDPAAEAGQPSSVRSDGSRSDPDAIDPNVVRSPSAESDAVTPNVVGPEDYSDPLVVVNRGIFAFNDVTYRYALLPLARSYVRVVPEPGRRGVARVFENLRTPMYAINHLLQLDPRAAGNDLSRFLVNTSIGLVGVFDPASEWFEFEPERTSLGETLSTYGVGYGIYLVLPLAGPSDARDLSSFLLDFYLTPIPYAARQPASSAVAAVDAFQQLAPTADEYEVLYRKSRDPYLFFRNLHLQGVQRDARY